MLISASIPSVVRVNKRWRGNDWVRHEGSHVLITLHSCLDYTALMSWLHCTLVLITLHSCLDYIALMSWLHCTHVLITLHSCLDYTALMSWLHCTHVLITLHSCPDLFDLLDASWLLNGWMCNLNWFIVKS